MRVMSESAESPCEAEGTPSTRAAAGLRPPAGLVRADGARVDWSHWFLTDEDDVGESCEHGETSRLLLSCLEMLARERGWAKRMIGGNQFFAWRADEPLVRVSPDLYVLEDPPARPWPTMWQTWLPGHPPPLVAVEIVSRDWRKDYEDAPAKYWQLGCAELVVFDPEAALGVAGAAERVPLQVYRRDTDGVYVRAECGAGPVSCLGIGAFLVSVRAGQSVRLRVARDANGLDLVPSVAEALDSAAARAAAAEARVRDLEARLRGDPDA